MATLKLFNKRALIDCGNDAHLKLMNQYIFSFSCSFGVSTCDYNVKYIEKNFQNYYISKKQSKMLKNFFFVTF